MLISGYRTQWCSFGYVEQSRKWSWELPTVLTRYPLCSYRWVSLAAQTLQLSSCKWMPGWRVHGRQSSAGTCVCMLLRSGVGKEVMTGWQLCWQQLWTWGISPAKRLLLHLKHSIFIVCHVKRPLVVLTGSVDLATEYWDKVFVTVWLPCNSPENGPYHRTLNVKYDDKWIKVKERKWWCLKVLSVQLWFHLEHKIGLLFLGSLFLSYLMAFCASEQCYVQDQNDNSQH